MKVETAPTREMSITITGSVEEFTLLYQAMRSRKRTTKESAALVAFSNSLGDLFEGIVVAPKPDKKRAQRLKNAAQRDIVDAMPVAPVPDVAA